MSQERNPVTWDRQGVRALRQHLRLTQAKLAKELGTRQQTISEWETGMYKPRGTSATLLTIVAERSGFKYGSTVNDEAKKRGVLG
ncbi:MAG: helix-turn-helix domain-containing protein [Dehalococcoidia bacterium]|nr:helix-turn-helix domain-containing protein [Dehalococcoidia bacterium]